MLLILQFFIIIVFSILLFYAKKHWNKIIEYICIIWTNVGKPYLTHKLNITVRKIVLYYFSAVVTLFSGNILTQLLFSIEVTDNDANVKTLFGVKTGTIDGWIFGTVVCLTIVTILCIVVDYKLEVHKRKKLKKTLVLMYAAKIEKDIPILSYDMACKAIEKEYEPSDASPMRCPIEIELNDLNEEEFWTKEEESLTNYIKNKLFPYLQMTNFEHVSVFAIAPMPLLVKLGTLLNEKYSVEVYQKHRSPDNWNRLDETTDQFQVNRPVDVSKQPVLVFSLSDRIIGRIKKLYGDTTSIWEVTVPNPNMDMMRTKKQQEEFRRIVRDLLNEITHASDFESINVHMAMPVSCAIEFGRVWMPKAHKSLKLFDYRSKKENESITIKDK